MNTGSVRIPSQEANLQLSIVALKSLLSEYALRTKQSEQMCSMLLTEKISPEVLMNTVTLLMTEHSENRSLERAVHQQAVLQSLVIALTQLNNSESLADVLSQVNTIVQSLTLSISSMNPNK